MVLNDVTKLVELPECLKDFSDFAHVVKHSTSFRMILVEGTKLLDLSECPKYSF